MKPQNNPMSPSSGEISSLCRRALDLINSLYVLDKVTNTGDRSARVDLLNAIENLIRAEIHIKEALGAKGENHEETK